MLYYNRIDVPGGIFVHKTSTSKECDVCYYWHFLNYRSKFQTNACNRCDDLLMMYIKLSDIDVFNNKGSD